MVSYLRVSTARQGDSGLGLSAQQRSIAEYVTRTGSKVLAEFTEIESGKKSDRPVLDEALKLCAVTGATLIVGRLDRLSRDINFVTGLQKTGVKFIAADLPEANEMMIQILSVISTYERELICKRTKAALHSARIRGPVFCAKRNRYTLPLGAAALQNLHPEKFEEGRKKGIDSQIKKADEFAARLSPIINRLQEQGIKTLRDTAEKLNESGILTPRGLKGRWTPQAVKNLLLRLK
jgi:hypothetical protein